MERTQELLDERIIREITPIFDTTGARLQLDAGRRAGSTPSIRSAPPR